MGNSESIEKNKNTKELMDEYKLENRKNNDNENKIEKDNERTRFNYPSLTTDNENNDNEEEHDKFNGIKTSLKFMYKNNYVSATFDDICAHIIQSSWKKFKSKTCCTNRIDVIYSSSKLDKMDKIEFLIYGYKYRKYDIIDYTGLKEVLKEYNLKSEDLPIIFINDYFVGGVNDLQLLIDGSLLEPIYKSEYFDYCLNCHSARYEDDIELCPYCFKEFTFFSKSNILKSIWDNRFN